MEIKANGLRSGLEGIQRGLRDLNQAAQEIASANVTRAEPVSLADSLVAAIEAQRQVEASANVVRRVDQTVGSLIDIFV